MKNVCSLIACLVRFESDGALVGILVAEFRSNPTIMAIAIREGLAGTVYEHAVLTFSGPPGLVLDPSLKVDHL
jgi:hypothetical protein